jgi:hypothetical protein
MCLWMIRVVEVNEGVVFGEILQGNIILNRVVLNEITLL